MTLMTTHHDMTPSHHLGPVQVKQVHTKVIKLISYMQKKLQVQYVYYEIEMQLSKNTLLILSIPCPLPLDNLSQYLNKIS